MRAVKTKANQAIELFNELADLDIGDVEDAVRILFCLRALDAGYPNATVKICRADAALIAGYRQEAINSLDVAYQLRAGQDIPFLQRLQLILLFSGQTSRAIEVARDLGRQPEPIACERGVCSILFARRLEAKCRPLLDRRAQVPGVAREKDGNAVVVLGRGRGMVIAKVRDRLGVVGLKPARRLKRRRVETHPEIVFVLEPRRQHIELQRPDNADNPVAALRWLEDSRHPLLGQLFESVAQVL